MRTDREVRALLEQIAREAAALDGPARRALGPILAEAEREVARDLARWLATVTDGAERFTAHHLRVVLMQLRRGLREIRDLEPEVRDLLVDRGYVAGALAIRHVSQEVAALSDHFAMTLQPISIDVAATLAQGNRMLIPRFKSSAARYAGKVGEDLKRQLAIGVIRSETIDQMTNRLIRLGGPRGWVYVKGRAGEKGAVGEYIAEGLFRRYKYTAERLVRTEVLHGYNLHADNAITEVAKTEPGMMRAWNAAMDRRVCLVCRSLDGKTAPIGGLFPGGYIQPPAHPNCRCSVVAWHEGWGNPP